MKIEDNYLIFDDGTEIYASMGVIGLYDDDQLVGGYDDYLYGPDGQELLLQYRKEIAEFMVLLWTKYRDKLNGTNT